MKNKKYLIINLSLILIRKIIITLLYYIFPSIPKFFATTYFASMPITTIQSICYTFLDELFFIPSNYWRLNVLSYIDFRYILFIFILATIIYTITQTKKEKPNNKLMLALTITHTVGIIIYIYVYYIKILLL